MLITVYNNEASPRFETDFKSNLILPKNCELKLTNAFISLSHKITIPDTTIKITANKNGGTARDVVLSAGTYSLQGLANEVNTKAQAVADGNKLSLKVDFEYNNELGYDKGCYKLLVDGTSLLANVFQEIDTDAAGGYGTWVTNEDDTLVTTITSSIRQTSGVNFFGVNEIKDASTPPVNTTTWGYLVENEQIVFHNWLRDNQVGTEFQPPNIPSLDSAYGAFSFQDNGRPENYMCCLQDSTAITGLTANNDFTDLINLENAPIVIEVIKTTNGAFNQGEIRILENAAANLTEVASLKAGDEGFPFTTNDQIGVSVVEGGKSCYWIKKASTTKWIFIATKIGAARYNYASTDNLKFGFSIFSKNTDGQDVHCSFKNLHGSFAGTDIEADDYGQYVKWDWNGFETKLGFGSATYESDTSGTPNLSSIIEDNNNGAVQVDGANTTESYKTAPYLNLMIENLPIKSYSDTSTDITNNGLDNSKCIASIPRYDQNGNFAQGYNLRYDPVEANVIKLHNEHEINISQLRFRLQQADGQIPTDVENPMAFVLDFNGDK